MLAPAGWLQVDGDQISGFVCSHNVYTDVEWAPGERYLDSIESRFGRPDFNDVGPDGPVKP